MKALLAVLQADLPGSCLVIVPLRSIIEEQVNSNKFDLEVKGFFPPKSPTEILKLMPQRRHASETLEFSVGFAAFFGVREEFFRAAFIQLNLVILPNDFKTVSCYPIIFPTGFSQGRRLLIDLISGGAKLVAAPLNARQWEAVNSLPTFSAPSPLPTGILYSPQFCSHRETKMAARRTQRSVSTISRKNRGL